MPLLPLSDAARSEVRSVLHLAVHFVELKERATEFLRTFSASQRGFFTPSEDDQVRHLLVSYRQSRNALLDLVAGYRAEESTSSDEHSARFLAAFAGALVLIDAARFLRDTMHDRPVVRQKLNEPEPHFGIPEGTYDHIQKSLTSPVHAWHLYHAQRFFEEHDSELRDVAKQDDEVAQVFDLVSRLYDRLEVGVRRFAIASARQRSRALRTRLRRDIIGRAVYGLQKAVSMMMSDVSLRRNHVPGLPAHVLEQLQTLLAPGDVLVTRKEHAATNYFLPGFWPHAALYVGDTETMASRRYKEQAHVSPHWSAVLDADRVQRGRVVESLKDGVRMRSLAVTLQCDAITVLRPLLSEAAIAEIVNRAFFHVGKPYDFDFDFSRSDRMVCTEVVYRSYDGVEQTAFHLTRRAGRMTLAAEDLMQMALERRAFEVLASFAPTHVLELTRGPTAERLVRDTIAW